jgi:hypothetical protein
MSGLKDFTTQAFSPRVVCTQAAGYTVLLSDEMIQINGAYTMTLPIINTMQGTTTHKKVYRFKNIHATANGTIAAGTGNTINGRAVYTLMPNEEVVILASETATDWTIASPFPPPALLRMPFSVALNTSGTTAQNVFDASGAPANIDVTAVLLVALDTNAGNIKVKNGTAVINDSTTGTAKSSTAGIMTGAVALTTPAVATGSIMTVESDSTNGNATVIIVGTVQTYA